jgi:hypothetical protein
MAAGGTELLVNSKKASCAQATNLNDPTGLVFGLRIGNNGEDSAVSRMKITSPGLITSSRACSESRYMYEGTGVFFSWFLGWMRYAATPSRLKTFVGEK